MGFKKEVKYGAVTLDFILECAKIMKFDPKDDKTLRKVLHLIGFQVSILNEETGEYKPCQIDRINRVNVRCIDKPYMCRETTVFSGRLRDKSEFPLVDIYEKMDILDVNSSVGTAFVNSLDFDIPVVEKVNTRKYTRKEDRSETIVMDLPEFNIESLTK
jgi:hypothetical protein